MRLIQLVIDQFEDLNLKENFKRLSDYVQAHSLLHGFAFVDREFTEAASHARVKHGLGFMPLDVVILRGHPEVTVNFDLCTATELDLTVTAACRFRAFVGSYSTDR